MPIESERRWLLNSENSNWYNQVVSSMFIMQGYLAAKDGLAVRVRIVEDQAFLTVKSPPKTRFTENGPEKYCHEYEYCIPRNDAVELLAYKQGNLIHKTRYVIVTDVGNIPRKFELDIFHGHCEGLKLVEYEVSGVNLPFTAKDCLPAFIGTEITGNNDYSNLSLATNGLPNYKDKA